MRFFKTLQILLPLMVGCAISVTPAQAQPEERITTTRTATAGKVRAELSYQTETFPDPLGELQLYQPRLKVVRDSQAVLDEVLPPSSKGAGLRYLDGPEVRDLDGDGELEILLNLRADYEHPGSTLIYRYDAAANRYVLNQPAKDEKLQVSNDVEIRRVASSNYLRAELAFRQDIVVQGEVTLKLTRKGQIITKRVDLGEDEIATVDGPAIIDLDGEAEPEVVLNVFSRGAYCCAFTLIYHYIPARKTYARLQHLWGPYRNVAVLKKSGQGGLPEFLSRNEEFSGEFGPYAVSGASPIQIWRYRRGRLQDVTRRYPNLIREDAQKWWEAYTDKKSDWHHTPYPLTAYLADLHRLGEGRQGWKKVQQAYDGDDRREFFRKLRRELKKHGYAK